MPQLISDCLCDILEHLENDKTTLFSCLLVNRIWCEIAVRILWRDGLKYKTKSYITLISCLPKESIEILHDNEIMISIPSSKSPMFNYATFCKYLSINMIRYNVRSLIENQGKTVWKQDLKKRKAHILIHEILNLFMSKISSLKFLYLYSTNLFIETLTTYPGAENCLRNLSGFICSSDSDSNFIYQLSQICNNLLSL